MKEKLTKDGVLIKYEKDENKSIIGQYVCYTIYDKNDKLLGQRIGVRDIPKLNYEDLFENGKMKFDMRPPKGKEDKEVIQEPLQKLPPKAKETSRKDEDDDIGMKEIKKVEEVEKEKLKAPAHDEHSSLGDGIVESRMLLRITFRGKRKVTSQDLLEYIGKKYTIHGYEISTTIKKVKGEDAKGEARK